MSSSRNHACGTVTLGYVLVAFASIWLSLSVKYIKKILANFALFILLRWHKPSTPQPQDNTENERGPLTDQVLSMQSLARIVKDTSGVRDLFVETYTHKDLRTCHRLWLFAFTFLASFTGLGMIVGGVYAARVQTEGPAKLASGVCGLWLFDEGRGSEQQAAHASKLDLKKETKAADYSTLR